MANEAIWREGVTVEQMRQVKEACLADFGVRVASDEPWTLNEWLRVIREAGFEAISADLTEEHLKIGKARNDRMGVRSLVSAALTRFYWLRSLLTPGVRRARARYRVLAHKHRDDGLYIEPRLFVLRKPVRQES